MVHPVHTWSIYGLWSIYMHNDKSAISVWMEDQKSIQFTIASSPWILLQTYLSVILLRQAWMWPTPVAEFEGNQLKSQRWATSHYWKSSNLLQLASGLLLLQHTTIHRRYKNLRILWGAVEDLLRWLQRHCLVLIAL